MSTKEEIYKVIETEREYQDLKWGEGRKHEIPTWFLIMRKELEEAEDAWLKKGRIESLIEISQAIAVGVACLEEHGAYDRFVNFESAKERAFAILREQNKKDQEE